MAENSTHDIISLISSSDKNYLVRNNGDKVDIESLKGKKVGLYFSASWCGPCQRFTPKLVGVYNELLPKGDFEVVFVSADSDEESFQEYFSKMPWVAIPFSDVDTRSKLDELFEVQGIPHFVIIGENGKVLTNEGDEIIREYGVNGYPFTQERVKEIKDQEEEAKKNQSLTSLLVTPLRDFVISTDGKKVPVTELEGKTVGLYFSLSSYDNCIEFTQKLTEVYEELIANGENFEIVTLPLDDDDDDDKEEEEKEEDSLKENSKSTPWFSLPCKDKIIQKLVKHFELSTLPTLVIIGPNGKTVHLNAAEAVEEHGSVAYPFTPEKFLVLEEIAKEKLKAQTLESILVSEGLNFVVGKDGVKVPISNLVGKFVMLYFSAHWCPPCRGFTPTLIEVYHKIKAKDDQFEVIFISSDRDQSSFEEYYSDMPWLALPFGDKRKKSLSHLFKVQGIPMLVAIGKNGNTITTDARNLIMLHGESAYPFTNERLKEIEEEFKEMAKGWPEKVKHALHEHELTLTHLPAYICDGCDEKGKLWSFKCEDCDFDLHPKCALVEDNGKKDDDVVAEEKSKDDWVCEGDVCRKA